MALKGSHDLYRRADASSAQMHKEKADLFSSSFMEV